MQYKRKHNGPKVFYYSIKKPATTVTQKTTCKFYSPKFKLGKATVSLSRNGTMAKKNPRLANKPQTPKNMSDDIFFSSTERWEFAPLVPPPTQRVAISKIGINTKVVRFSGQSKLSHFRNIICSVCLCVKESDFK